MARYRSRHRLRALLPRILASALIAAVILVTAAYLLPSLPGRVLHAPLLLLALAGTAAVLIAGGIALRSRTGSELAGYATEAVLPVAALALVLVPLARAETAADPESSYVASDPVSRAARTPGEAGPTSEDPFGDGRAGDGHRPGAGSGDGRTGADRTGAGSVGPGHTRSGPDDGTTEGGDAAGRDAGPAKGPSTNAPQRGNPQHRNDGPAATTPAATTAGGRTEHTGDPGSSGDGETPDHSKSPTARPPRSPAPTPTPTSTGPDPDPTRTSDPDITIIARGHLIGLGTRVTGTVELTARPDGSQRIILNSDFSGGSLDAGVHLYLTPGLSRLVPGATWLGPLRAVTGRQGYPVPRAVKAGRPVTLLLVPEHGLAPDALAVLRP